MKFIRLLFCLSLSTALPGCDTQTASADPDDAQDARVDQHAGDAAVVDATSTDAAPMDAFADDPNCLPDEPSTRTVRFTVRNPSDGPIYVPVQGDLCQPYVIRDVDGQTIPRRVVNPCTAECNCVPGTPLSWVTAYQRLAPGEAHVFEWHARQVVRCEQPVHCPEFEEQGRPARFSVATPRWRTLAPADLQIELAYEPELPDGCAAVPDATGRIECQGPEGMHWFGRCEATAVITAPFALEEGPETAVELAP